MSRRGSVWIIVPAILVIIAIPVVVLFVAPMTYAPLLERAVRSGTGLQARFAALEMDLFPPHFAVEELKLFNPDPNFSEPLLVVEHFSVTADAAGYLEDAPDWWRAQGSGVQVRLARDADGRSNWSVPAGEEPAPEPQQKDDGPTPLFSFDTIQISDLDLLRVSPGQADRLHVAQLSLDKDTDERLRIALDGSYRDQPLTASGTLVRPGSERAQHMAFQASVFGGELRLEGIVGHDGITPGEARITANAEDLSTLGHLLDQDLSAWAPFKLSGTLQAPRPGRWKLAAQGGFGEHRFDVSSAATVSGPRWELDELAVAIDDGKVTGNAVLDRADRLLRASLASPRLDIDRLTSLAPQDADSGDDQTIDLDTLRQWTFDVDVQIEELLWQGYTAAGVMLEAASDADALQISAGIDKASATSDGATSWQLVEPLQVDATLALAAKDNSAGKLTARFSSSGLDGEIDATLPAGARRPMQAGLQTTVENFSAVQGIDTERWDTFLPLSVSVQVRGTPQQMQLDPLKISFSDDTLEGRLKVDRTSTPLRISGDLQGSALDVNRFRTTPAPQNGKEAAEQDNRKAGNVIGDQPIDWSWLEAALLELDVHLDKLTFNEAVFRNVRTQVALADGELNIDPLDADLSNGGVRGHVRMRKADAGAAIDIRLIVTQLVPADLSPQGKGLIDGGETDLFIELRASGATPHELAAALNGEVVLEIQRATVRNDFLDIVGSDLLTQTLSLINPFTKQDDRTELECAAVRFVAEDGVLSSPDQIVIETSKMKIRGGGEINLDDETLRIDLVPSAREGVGIGAGDVARFVRLGGTLGNPQPEADPEAILKSGATIGAAIATGGVSLLAQGLFNRARNVGTACGRIFEDTTDIPEAIQSEDPAVDSGE